MKTAADIIGNLALWPKTSDLPLDLKGLRYLLTHEIDTFLGTPTTAPLTGMDYIYNQIREMIIMAACGACLAFLYEIYDVGMGKVLRRAKVHLRPPGYEPDEQQEKSLIYKIINSSGLIRITDIIFCIIAGFMILQFWYSSSYCSASLHEGAALIAGAVT